MRVTHFAAKAHEVARPIHAFPQSAQLPDSEDAIPQEPRTAGVAPLGVMELVLTLAPGGTERLIIEIATRLKHRYRLVVCCLDRPGEWAGEVTEAGIPLVSLDRRPGFRPSLAGQIARVADAYRLNLLHCHHYSPFVYGRLAVMLRPGTRVIYTEHGRLSDAPPTRKRRLVNPWLDGRSVTMCAVSGDLRRHMAASGFPEEHIGVIYNGIDPRVAPTPGDRLRARQILGIPPSAHVVGTIARLDPVKDLGTLLAAFSRIHRKHEPPDLVIVGDGPERAALEANARHLGLAGRVHFAGHRNDARELLPALDLFVNCSIIEGVSLTILEAMAAAIPVVASAVGGTPEVVVEGETGVLVPSRSPERLSEAIDTLLGDPGRRRALGNAGRARVLREFTIDRMVSAYDAMYAAGGER